VTPVQAFRPLELLVHPNTTITLSEVMPIAAEALNLLDMRFKSIPFPGRELSSIFEVYPERDSSDDLTKPITRIWWTVKVTELPKKFGSPTMTESNLITKRICNAYFLMNDFGEKMAGGEEKEKDCGWRNIMIGDATLYWKNDSDYD